MNTTHSAHIGAGCQWWLSMHSEYQFRRQGTGTLQFRIIIIVVVLFHGKIHNSLHSPLHQTLPHRRQLTTSHDNND